MDDYEGVAVYQTWYEGAELLGEEFKLKAMDAIIRYGLYGEKNDHSIDDPVLEALLRTWRAQVDFQKKTTKGGAPKGNQNAKGNKGGTGRPKKTQPKNTTLINKEKVNENDNKVNSNLLEASASDTLWAVGSEPVDEERYVTGEELMRERGLIT